MLVDDGRRSIIAAGPVCVGCGLTADSFIHSRESTGYHEFRAAPSIVPAPPGLRVPAYMDMEDAVRALDQIPEVDAWIKATVNRMRDALVDIARARGRQ